MIKQSLTLVPTADNEEIAVWQLNNDPFDTSTSHSNNKQNLLFIHGAFSDKSVCLGIANYFANLGHQCFIMEWRGHGDSPQPQSDYHLEDVALYDIKATFDYLFTTLHLKGLHAITHSGGGLCLTMFLTRYPQFSDILSSFTMVACQAFAATPTPMSQAKLRLGKAVTRLLGYVPGKQLKLGSKNESYYLMSQWMDWNLNKNFTSYSTSTSAISSDRTNNPFNKLTKPLRRYFLKEQASSPIDYRTLMPTINTPIYSICGANDFVAPPQGCLQFLQAFANPNNVLREFAFRNSDLEDYNHTRIFLSRNAAKEVWPTVLEWIEQHSMHMPLCSGDN